MNKLVAFLRCTKLDETYVLNILQGKGIISSECVQAADVPAPDDETAVCRLMGMSSYESFCRWFESGCPRRG